MRIAFLTAEYPPHIGGVGDYTRCLALALSARSHEVSVITTSPHMFCEATYAHIIAQRCISAWDWRCWHDTILALDRIRPDILHIQYQTGAYGMHPAINLLPWRLQGLAHRPHVAVTFHDLLEPYLFPKAGWLRRWITLRLARDADVVIVTNDDDAADLTRSRVNVTVIPIGSNIPVAPPPTYDRGVWRSQLGVRPQDVLIVYFGLLLQSKGGDILLDALKYLVDSQGNDCPFYVLMVGGKAPTPQGKACAAHIQAQIHQMGLHHRVIQAGYGDEATVSAHLLAADGVALPFRDGASFRSGSLLAALTHGVPVITTYSPKNPHPSFANHHHISLPQLIDGHNVLLVPAGDSIALAHALLRLSRERELQNHLRVHAKETGSHFHWEEIARQHEVMFQHAERRASVDLLESQ